MKRNEQRFRVIRGTRRGVVAPPLASQKGGREFPEAPSFSASPDDLAEALRTSEQRLSALLEDRGRIGRDLHDCVLQSLYAIGLSLERSRRQGSSAGQIGRSGGNDVVDQLNVLIHDIRQMITGLEQGTVEQFDLSAELRGLINTYSQIGHFQVALELQPAAVDVLTGEEEREILNIVREALSNCARHAHATQASVALQTRGGRVRLSIDDNGSGFEPFKKQVGGYGLANMAARAKKLGGHLTIRSHPGRGTKIVAEFVLEPVLTPV